jgi:hypothetical protein
MPGCRPTRWPRWRRNSPNSTPVSNAAHCALQGNVDADAVAPMLRFILIDGPAAIVKPYLTNHQPIPACVDAILRASHDAVRGWAYRTN